MPPCAPADAHNILDLFPTLADPTLRERYSPDWDLHLGVWTDQAVADGLNGARTDANVLRQLAARGLVTSPGGIAAAVGSQCAQLPGARLGGRASDPAAGTQAAADPLTSQGMHDHRQPRPPTVPDRGLDAGCGGGTAGPPVLGVLAWSESSSMSVSDWGPQKE